MWECHYRLRENHLRRRQDCSIGLGAPVRANMRTSGVTDAAVRSSLLEIELCQRLYGENKHQGWDKRGIDLFFFFWGSFNYGVNCLFVYFSFFFFSILRWLQWP